MGPSFHPGICFASTRLYCSCLKGTLSSLVASSSASTSTAAAAGAAALLRAAGAGADVSDAVVVATADDDDSVVVAAATDDDGGAAVTPFEGEALLEELVIAKSTRARTAESRPCHSLVQDSHAGNFMAEGSERSTRAF